MVYISITLFHLFWIDRQAQLQWLAMAVYNCSLKVLRHQCRLSPAAI